MPIEHKPHRASSSALVHLEWLLDQALEQTFPASDAVAIDFERKSHDREAQALEFRSARWQPEGGPADRTETLTRIQPALVLTAEMRSKLTVALTACCNMALTSRLFKVMKHPSENQSQEVLAGLVERVTYHNVENGFLGSRSQGAARKSTAQGAKTITTQPRIKFSPHHCALLSLPIYAPVLASSACQRAAHKTATYRNLRSPIGSADAIGRRKSNLTS